MFKVIFLDLILHSFQLPSCRHIFFCMVFKSTAWTSVWNFASVAMSLTVSINFRTRSSHPRVQVPFLPCINLSDSWISESLLSCLFFVPPCGKYFKRSLSIFNCYHTHVPAPHITLLSNTMVKCESTQIERPSSTIRSTLDNFMSSQEKSNIVR